MLDCAYGIRIKPFLLYAIIMLNGRGATDYPISDYPADIRPFLGYPGSIEIRLFGIRQYPLSDLLSADPTIGENMGKKGLKWEKIFLCCCPKM